jgi:hypothetical protein
MQQGRTAGQSFKPKQFSDYYDSPYPLQVRVAKIIAHSEKGLTVPEIQELAGCSADSVRALIKTMRAIKGVYICDWRHGRSIAAVYALGSAPDVAKPVLVCAKVADDKGGDPELAKQKALKALALAKHQKAVAKALAIKERAVARYYKALAKALVPKRSEKKQQEVNRMYLNWISGGAYG